MLLFYVKPSNKYSTAEVYCHLFQLNDALARTSFTMDNEIYSFSKFGDLDTGYDINIWEAAHGNKAESIKNVTLTTVARYMIKNSTFFRNDQYRNRVENITVRF